jgi:hypothetical protein
MNSYIEPLYKTKNIIKFGWKPENGAASYKMYVGLSSINLTLLYSNISAQMSERSQDFGKVPYEASIADVQTALGLAATKDFSNTIFYFAITFVNAFGVESGITGSTVVEVFPVGIGARYMKDDPTIFRQGFVFSQDALKWAKMAGSSMGAVITDPSDFYKANIITEYTYDTTNLATVKSYLTDSTVGSPAKLTTYTYTGTQLTKMVVTDSTVSASDSTS